MAVTGLNTTPNAASVAPTSPVLQEGWAPTQLLLRGPRTICLFGDSGAGKTSLGGELIEHVYTFGKSPTGKPLKTILYTADEGGLDVLRPHMELGLVQVVNLFRLPNPWDWLNHITLGRILDGKDKWIPYPGDDVGMWMFEGMTSFGEALREGLAGTNDNLATKPSTAGDKDAHGRNYGVAQDRIAGDIKQSFMLPGIKLWTARARRADDNDTTSTILGPQIVGKALTSEVPAWFNYTFHVQALAGDELMNKAESHRLYLGGFVDKYSKGAKGLGNSRKPLDGGELPAYIEPASLVRAFGLLEGATDTATSAMSARLKAKGLLATA